MVANIEVPTGITLGSTRMRVVKMWSSDGAYPDACGTMGYGQSEDYAVEIGPESVEDFAQYDFAYGPNPTTQAVNLSAQVMMDNVSVYNVLGQKVLAADVNNTRYTLDISQFQNGAYFMEVTINGERRTFKIVKQ